MFESKVARPQPDNLYVMRLLWGALLSTSLAYGIVLLQIFQNDDPSTIVVRSFAQAVETSGFTYFFIAGILQIFLSRIVPKALFKSKLSKLTHLDRADVIRAYMPGFFIGIALLESVILLGFVQAILHRFFPLYLAFAGVAVANMLIRFPRWNIIKGMAEELTKTSRNM